MLEELVHLDQTLLLEVNERTGNPNLDYFMVLLSAKWIWIPFYGYLLYKIYKKYGRLNTFWVVLGALTLLILTDQGSVQLFKENIQRFRPCHDPVLMDKLMLPNGRCGGQYGFISTHASNVFGLSSFIVVLFASQNRMWYLMFLWASLVSFSRVYLAVHYPSDVLVGALFGVVLGISVASLTLKTLRT